MRKVIEGGAALDPSHADHIRRIIALKLGGLTTATVQAAQDQNFFELAATTVEAEIIELHTFAKDEDLPDLWDIAYEDLLRLKGDK